MTDRHVNARRQRAARIAIQAQEEGEAVHTQAFAPRMTGGVGFEIALGFAKMGYRATRKGWNGQNMYIYVVTPTDPELLPYLMMKTTMGTYVPWLASQTDLLGHDWMVMDAQGAEIMEDYPTIPYTPGTGAGPLGNQ